MVCALGVQLGEAGNGILKVCNTEKRIRETIGLLDDFMARGTLLKREALVPRGRLRFVTPLFSETWKDRSSGHASSFKDAQASSSLESMKLLRCRIADGKPRRLTCDILETLYLFTDASFDSDKQSGLGAILVDGAGKVLAWFGLQLMLEQLAPLLDAGQETITGELQTLAVAMSLLVWENLSESVQLMVYIDNEGSKYSLIKGYSTSGAITAVCALAATTLDAHFVLSWVFFVCHHCPT